MVVPLPVQPGRALGLGLLLAASLAGEAAAQAWGALIPQPAICTLDRRNDPPRRVVDPQLLVEWLLANDPISDRALDANADGDTLFHEKQVALAAEDYCFMPGRRCSAADVAAQDRLHETLVGLVETEGGLDYTFERLRRPDPVDREEIPALAEALEVEGRRYQIGEILVRGRPFVRIICNEPRPPVVAGMPAPAAGPRPLALGLGLEQSGFRLTGKIDDLSKNRDRLRDVDPAEFSIVRDLQDGVTRFQIDAVAGYEVEVSRGDDIRVGLIPFGLMQRFFDGSQDTVDNLGAGMQVAAQFRAEDLGSSEIAITPLLETDSSFDSLIGSLQFRWTPTLPPDAPVPLGFYEQFGPVVATFGLDALAEGGRIFDPGDNTQLIDQGDFFRVGGRLRFRVRGAQETLIEQFEIEVTDRYLRSLSGEPENVNLFESAFSYIFPGVENYRLSFTYSTGRTEQSLEQIDQWRTQLGVRF